MSGEADWAQRIQARLDGEFGSLSSGNSQVRVAVKRKLTYANEILGYRGLDPETPHRAGYETDILIFDEDSQQEWIPRIVVECKLGSVTTHDALTYSTKAASHKHVHPYLRYGILVGNFGTALPGRLIRHGAYFDFMIAWHAAEPTNNEWSHFVELLKDELGGSRSLHQLLRGRRRKGQETFSVLHRPLRLT